MSLSCKPHYRTTNWKQYYAAFETRGSLTVWLDRHMAWFAASIQAYGTQPVYEAVIRVVPFRSYLLE